MYIWTLVGHDINEAEVRSGCSDDLAEIMRHAEPFLIGYRAFACRIVEVVPRISVVDLQSEFQPTGRVWLGRRTIPLDVRWLQTFKPADTDVLYRVGERTIATLRDLDGAA